MKRFLLFICLIATTLTNAQPYGNEWINYSQKYIKVKITEDGLYRVDYNTLKPVLSTLGVNIDTLDPRNLQVFGRGEEIYIHHQGSAQNIFNTSDYIEFYAQGNDGWLDSLLYTSPSLQANPYFSLFSDTAAYYITWNLSLIHI